MELLQLRYFYESARTQNFSKTAKMFMVPTTSVSASIKRLEQELGCQLFDRTTNRIRLNMSGRKLYQTLDSVFHDIDRTVSELSDQAQDKRRVRILVRDMRREITDIITEYSRLHPDIYLQTVFNHNNIGFEDYAIVIDDHKDRYEDYDRFELCNIRLQLKCSADHPLCGQQLTLKDLSDQPFVSMNVNSNMHKILLKACARAGFNPRISVLCNDVECYEKFIATGVGIGLQSESSKDMSSQIRSMDVVDFDEGYPVYVYYSNKEYYGNVKDFIAFIKKTVL